MRGSVVGTACGQCISGRLLPSCGGLLNTCGALRAEDVLGVEGAGTLMPWQRWYSDALDLHMVLWAYWMLMHIFGWFNASAPSRYAGGTHGLDAMEIEKVPMAASAAREGPRRVHRGRSRRKRRFRKMRRLRRLRALFLTVLLLGHEHLEAARGAGLPHHDRGARQYWPDQFWEAAPFAPHGIMEGIASPVLDLRPSPISGAVRRGAGVRLSAPLYYGIDG